MRTLMAALLVGAMAILAWLAWNPVLVMPQHLHGSPKIIIQVPEQEDAADMLWRVMTRRMVWKKGFEDMQARLVGKGLSPVVLKREEPVELHAYDDVRLFDSFAEANKVKESWLKKGFEADVLETGDSLYRVGLGRFYLDEYAGEMEQRLKDAGETYRYERRTVVIPSYRLVFPAQPKQKAQHLWDRLRDMGVASPILMPAREFDQLYPPEPVPDA
ncbi:MAG: hypothetical protein COW62_07830 [Zetaproteobacteria bacterium CG17_big_fil_post_rev_8_21_14_2_50_50_13]|nr:MAG: hypothetical protein COW62_07830 [Zetaproteobacteria bacterium CG17_big_fil_post_rev_8_21_14_2_50_50_13]PIY56971.1 MAG: hypothetical protein COZ00_01245 [Zetaproteobacteria bacterium CG_4_10_14_0_8_um_filter_49_80]